MQFLNVSNFNNTNINQPTIYQMNRFLRPIIQSNIQSVNRELPTVENKTIESVEPKKKMLWGSAIWFLFHTMAEKIKDDLFSSLRVDLLNNIYSICVNLPCPICSTHAKEYLDKINFNVIQTKQDLKLMLFHFHNNVNKMKSYPIFLLEELDEKYSKANTMNIIHNFMYYFKDKNRSPKLIANDLQRQRTANVLKEWFSKNIQHFNL